MLPIIYRASDVGAPTLDGNKGSLITVLKDCLVNGFPARSCTITRSGSTATVTLTAHGFTTPSTVLIENANETEYNGSFSIEVVDANTFTYTVTGTPAVTATGSITAKIAGAGWTVALEDAPNFKIIFRNYYDGGDGANGSGRYYRVQDDGFVSNDTSNAWIQINRPYNAVITGMRNYSDINTPVSPFPRVMTGGDLHNLYAYGVTVRKAGGLTNPNNARPYMVIADNRTCYIITTSATVTATAIPSTNPYPGAETSRGVVGFGDIRQLNPLNTTTAKAFIFGGALNHAGIYTDQNNGGTINYGNLVVPSKETVIYLDTSLENSSKTVAGKMQVELNKSLTQFGGLCNATVVDGDYEHYPSPGTFSLVTEKIMVCENLQDPIRTIIEPQNNERYTFGYLPGLFSSPHTTSSSSGYRVGNELTVSTNIDTGERFLMYSLVRNATATFTSSESLGDGRLFAFKLEDWWL